MNHPQQEHSSDGWLNRHWCPTCEPYTGADSLLTACQRGWEIVGHRLDRSNRCLTQHITVHVFALQRGSDKLTMQVIHNPYVEKLAQKFTVNKKVELKPARSNNAVTNESDMRRAN